MKLLRTVLRNLWNTLFMEEEERRSRILAALDGSEGKTGRELSAEIGLGSGSTYALLHTMERENLVVSRWAAGSYPRRMLYRRFVKKS